MRESNPNLESTAFSIEADCPFAAAYAIVNSSNPKFSPILAAGAFLAFLVAALAPRLSLILAGVAYADDWAAGYNTVQAHLASYRPVSAGELWLMQSILGEDYLTLRLPKLLSAIWYALSLTLLMHIALIHRVPRFLFLLLGLATLLHPAFNELILWGVLSPFAMGSMLSVAGAAIVYGSGSFKYRAAGIILMCMGAAASQMASVIGACLLVTELAHRGVAALLSDKRKELVWRLAMVFIPPTCALVILIFLRNVLGYSDFESRTVGLSSVSPTGYLRDKFYVVSNAIANLYQAPLGVSLGSNIALRAFWPIVLSATPLLAVLLILSRVGLYRAIWIALSIPLALAIALSPLFAATAMPTGYRILNNLFLVFCLALSVALVPFWAQIRSRILVCIAISLVGISFTWSSLADINVRSAAWNQDLVWLDEAKASLQKTSARNVVLCSRQFPRPVESPSQKKGILVSYGQADALSYSVWYPQFLEGFLNNHGIAARMSASGDTLTGECSEACASSNKGNFGPHALVLKIASSTDFVCPANPSASTR